MAKTKRKANLASATAEKKNKVTKSNPFEIRFSREKHSVLNRKKKNAGKTDIVGRPGMARSRAIQKRKETLLQEYKIRHKNNVFVDKRIGEKDSELSAEDKMIARFTAERMKKSKKNIFNLGEEEALTHFGQSISQIEQFEDDPRSDDEDESSKKMNAEMNFGGFLSQNDLEFASGKGNSRKEWIEQMIADSKKRKFEQQKDKEETLKMTQDLDNTWKEISSSLKMTGGFYAKKFNEDDEDKEHDANDDYNKIMKELVFEPKKAKAQERLKTDEEIVKEQKEMLEKLEELRQKRMQGLDVQDSEASEDEEDEAQEEEEASEDESDEEQDGNDEYSDLEESEDEQLEKPKESKKAKEKAVKKVEGKEIPFTFSVPKTSEALDELLEERNAKEKGIILERMIKCNHPQFGKDNKAQLENLFAFLLQHIHDSASFDPDDEDENDIKERLESVQVLVPFLFDLAKFSPQPSGEAVRSVLQEKYAEFCKNSKTYPGFESLIFLKITTLLFPTSDYRHPVATPALQWMSQMLTNCKPSSRHGLACGLFVASVLTESISLSKKFSPELFNFLSGLIFMAVPKDKQTVIPFVPPFKVVGPESTFLVDCFDGKSACKPGKIKYQDCIFKSKNMDAEFGGSALKMALELMNKLVDLWADLPSAAEIFQKLKKDLLPKLNKKKLHKDLQESLEKLVQELAKIEANPLRSHTVPERKKEIKMLKLYDPELDDNFDPFVKKRKLSKEQQEMAKLNHKLKREKKGAKKDLRADAAFLARQKAKERREKDSDRMQKTKAILAGLGGQEGEYRQFQRQKKKKKH